MAGRLLLTVNKIVANPNKLFLIDGVGAFCTAFLLGLMRIWLKENIGMPAKVLVSLSIVAGVYGIYSISCYFLAAENWRRFLMLIAIANILYCCSTIVLVIVYYHSLTTYGIVYFLSEIAIITGLVIIEGLAINNKNNI